VIFTRIKILYSWNKYRGVTLTHPRDSKPTVAVFLLKSGKCFPG
jgi:hypothetical protein